MDLIADSVLIDTRKLWTKYAWHKKTGMSRSTIDRKIKDGEITHVKINGGTLIIG